MRRLSLPAFFVLLLVCTAVSGQPEKVLSSDKAVLPSVTDLLALYPRLSVDPKLGTYAKQAASDGEAVQLRYNYDSPDGQTPVSVQAMLVFIADVSLAKASYASIEKGMEGAAPTPGVTRVPRADAMAWGDEHSCQGFLRGGSQSERGIACVARKGHAVLLVSFAGQFDTSRLSHHDGMDTLLAARLRAIESYGHPAVKSSDKAVHRDVTDVAADRHPAVKSSDKAVHRHVTDVEADGHPVVSSADKAVLLDVTDVAAAYPKLAVDPKLGTYAKQPEGDGFMVVYKYHSPQGKHPNLSVESRVAILPTVPNAKDFYAGVKAHVAVVGKTNMPDVTREDRPDALAWGDEHACNAFIKHGSEDTILCAARKGHTVIVESVAGDIDTTALAHDHGMDNLLAARLNALATYEPREPAEAESKKHP